MKAVFTLSKYFLLFLLNSTSAQHKKYYTSPNIFLLFLFCSYLPTQKNIFLLFHLYSFSAEQRKYFPLFPSLLFFSFTNKTKLAYICLRVVLFFFLFRVLSRGSKDRHTGSQGVKSRPTGSQLRGSKGRSIGSQGVKE